MKRFFVLGVLLALLPGVVLAHGFGDRYTLPIPLNLYLGAAAVMVAVSFLFLGRYTLRLASFERYPRNDLLQLGWVRAMFAASWLRTAVQVFSIAVFLLVIATGFFGTQQAGKNFASVFIWVIFWVGFTFFTALVVNLWPLINPWSVLFDWVSRLWQQVNPDDSLELGETYPPRLSQWVAAVFLIGVISVEIVFNNSANGGFTAFLVLVYSVITWVGMALVGRHVWLRHAEVFSVLYALLARFAPTELEMTDRTVCVACSADCATRERCVGCDECVEYAPLEALRFNLRPWAAGLVERITVGSSQIALLMILLASVTFDGLTALQSWNDLRGNIVTALQVPGQIGDTALNALALALAIAVFTGLYLLVCATAERYPARVAPWSIASAIALSLLPIALAYQIAHYFTYILVLGQSLIPLVSDPFGWGWNLLGTAGYIINVNIVPSSLVWYIQLGLVIVGHVLAIVLSEVLTQRAVPQVAQAHRSQFPIIVLMILYTMSSLWILSQPIVTETPDELPVIVSPVSG